MVNVITALPARLLSLLGRRSLNWYRFTAALVVLGLLKGYSLGNIRFMIAQAALESDFGTSRIARELNNFTGMHFPTIRESENDGYEAAHDTASFVRYSKYKSPAQCAKDRVLWDSYWPDIALLVGLSDYHLAVSARYHSAPTYGSAVANVSNLHSSEFTSLIWATIALVPLEAFIAYKLVF